MVHIPPPTQCQWQPDQYKWSSNDSELWSVIVLTRQTRVGPLSRPRDPAEQLPTTRGQAGRCCDELWDVGPPTPLVPLSLSLSLSLWLTGPLTRSCQTEGEIWQQLVSTGNGRFPHQNSGKYWANNLQLELLCGTGKLQWTLAIVYNSQDDIYFCSRDNNAISFSWFSFIRFKIFY